MFLFFLNLVQTADHPNGVFWRRCQEICVTRLAGDQNLDVGQAELFPFVFVFDRGISGLEDLIFTGRHDVVVVGSIVGFSFPPFCSGEGDARFLL